MRAGRAIGGTLLAMAAVLLAAASISWSPEVTVHLRDAAGAPASGAYVRYHYEGSILNFVDSLDYVARGSVVTRADAEGRAIVPGRLHVRSPLRLTLPPRVFVDRVYVPRLHNAVGPIPPFSLTQPGVVEVEPGYRVTMYDVSGDPVLWERSLDQLYDFIRGSIEGRAPMADPRDGSAALVRELIDHLRAEQAALLARHRDARRVRPDEPPWVTPEQRAEWREQVDANLAREPLWGPVIERTRDRRLEQLERLEARLR